MPRAARKTVSRSVSSVVRFDSDEEVVAGVIGNLPGAWRAFHARFDRIIVACITKVTCHFRSLVSDEDVREIVAGFYVSILSKGMSRLRAYDSTRGMRISSWLGLLATNAAYDHLRKIRHAPRTECLTKARLRASELPDPFEVAYERERASITKATLARFSERDRKFATLYFSERMAPKDVARSMKISVKTVYSKKHKIQSRLTSELGTRLAA